MDSLASARVQTALAYRLKTDPVPRITIFLIPCDQARTREDYLETVPPHPLLALTLGPNEIAYLEITFSLVFPFSSSPVRTGGVHQIHLSMCTT